MLEIKSKSLMSTHCACFFVVVVVIAIMMNETNSFGLNGYCGVGNYNIVNDLNGNFGFDEKRRIYNVKMSRPDRTLVREYIKEAFKIEPVIVRLSVFYDDAMEEEWPGDRLYKSLRNLLYQTQLIFDQPEMAREVKIRLVVTSLGPLPASEEFHGFNQPGENILKEFANIAEVSADLNSNRADVAVLIMFRGWTQGDNMIGLANSQTFCRMIPFSVLMTYTTDVTQGITLAHELGHILGLFHDAPLGCPDDIHIMSGTGKTIPISAWSSCSTLGLPDYLASVSYCVYDPERTRDARPINQYFDFDLAKARYESPAMDMSLDEQCRSGYEGSKSLYQLTGNQRTSINLETCQSLVCLVGQRYQVGLGAALTGSPCKKINSSTEGYCLNTSCQ